MCGIAGVIFKGQTGHAHDGSSVNRILDIQQAAIAHRGPNHSGRHVRSHYGFLNARLAIVDVAGGDQPKYASDSTAGIVYNGEVYNHEQLRADLEARGHRFESHSDTEVLLKHFVEYGPQSFAKLNGMFAFCVWDERAEEIYIVRDGFGIKPLYIYEDSEKILFASELRALMACPNVDLSLSPAGIQDYLTFRYVQAPFTIFSKIRRLDAGTYLRIRGGVASQFAYWDVSYPELEAVTDSRSLEDVKREFTQHLEQAVRSQLMGEVPIGVLLSGGLDSSSIAYAVHRLGANLTTFSIGFPEANEFEYSRAVAQQFGLKHVEVLMTTEQLAARWDTVIKAVDDPLCDAACFPLYRLCEELKKEVIVVLSGEAADELLGGYPQYAKGLKHLASGMDDLRAFEAFMRDSYYFNDTQDFLVDRHLPPHFLRFRKYYQENAQLNAMLAYDMKTWMPENLMMKADKILMAHSLEGRFPYLDKELFEFCARLPQRFKIDQVGVQKSLLREVMKTVLPEKVLTRPKMGFTVPLEQILSLRKQQVYEALDAARGSELAQVLDLGAVTTCFDRHFEGTQKDPLRVWNFSVLFSWYALNMNASLVVDAAA